MKVLSDSNSYVNIKLESNHIYKLYGDIDHCQLNEEQVIELLSEYCKYLKLEDISVSLTKNNKYTKEGNSYHYVIPQYKCLVEDNKLFVEHLIEYAKNKYEDIGKWVDVSVYNCGDKGHFFRMPNQFKGARFDIPCSENIHEIKIGMMEDFLLSYISSDVKLFKPPDEWYVKKPKEKLHSSQQVPIINQCTSLSRKQVRYIKKLLKLLTIESMTERDSWLKVMMFLRRYDLRELAHICSKLCVEKYDSEEINTWAIINKGAFNPNNILVLEEVERIAGVTKRFDIESVKYDENTKKSLEKISERLGKALYGKQNKKKLNEMCIAKIETINDTDSLKGLLCDMYNRYDKIFNKKQKRFRKNGELCATYEYTINDEILNRHKVFLNALRDKMKIQCYDYDINDALDNGITK